MTDDDNQHEARFNGVHSAFPAQLSGGMTKRELLAALCLQGLLANPDLNGFRSKEEYASDAVAYADELLLALAQDLGEEDAA